MTEQMRIAVNPEQQISVIFSEPTRHLIMGPPVVVMVHGGPGQHKGSYDDVFGELDSAFSAMGLPCIRFDCRGCGESDGRPEDYCLTTAVQDLRAVTKWAKDEKGYTKFILVMAGLGATIGVIGCPSETYFMIFLWPIVAPKETGMIQFMGDDIGKKLETQDSVTVGDARIGRPLYDELNRIDLTPYAERIYTQTLIQHGDHDDYAPKEHVTPVLGHLNGSKDMTYFDEGGHGLPGFRERKQLFFNIDSFMNYWLERLDLVEQKRRDWREKKKRKIFKAL